MKIAMLISVLYKYYYCYCYCYQQIHVMSKEKYRSIFSYQMEAIVFIIFKIFLAKQAVLKVPGNVTLIFPSFSRGIFSYMIHSDQLCMSKFCFIFNWG